jgi:hypothetical protein
MRIHGSDIKMLRKQTAWKTKTKKEQLGFIWLKTGTSGGLL